MSPLSRRRLLALASSSVLAGCASPALVTRDGNRDPFEGGIGGTGIVGTLTGFGSLRVNGLRVDLSGSTRYVTALGPVSAEALAPGQTLTIAAERRADGIVARHVRIEFPLIGTLTERGSGLSVNGIDVRVERGATRAASIGSRVAVSGLWTRTGVVASRIDPAPAGPDLIAGDVVRNGATGLSIGGVNIFGGAGQAFPPSGSYLVATGNDADGGFVAQRLASGRFVTGAGRLRQLAIEGYLEPIDAAPGYRIAGLGHSFAQELRLAQLAADRAIFIGPYDGRFAARGGYTLPEGVSPRRALLRDGFDGPLGDRIVETG